ncbi:fungal-specific transcription factor domain-containing protein [Aspergillus spinulosporus]
MVLKAALCLGASHLIRCLSLAIPPVSTSPGLASAVTVKERFVSEKNALAESTEHGLSRRVDALCSRLEQFETPDELLKEAEALIAGCCLLYLYGISEGASNGSWQRWLNRSRDVLFSLLDARRTLQARSDAGVLPIHQRFMEFFRYHQALGSLTDYAQSDNEISSSNWGDMLKYSGASSELLPLDLIARIAALRSEAEITSSGPVIAQAVAIWKDLDDWEPRGVGAEIPSGYHALAHSYTAACFIWLFSILYPDNIADEKVQVVVRHCLEHLSSINTKGIYQFLLFPIFVVGMACTRQEDRTVLEGLLMEMEVYCRRGNVDACSRLVRKTWESYDAGVKRSWDWIHLMETNDVSVAIV